MERALRGGLRGEASVGVPGAPPVANRCADVITQQNTYIESRKKFWLWRCVKGALRAPLVSLHAQKLGVLHSFGAYIWYVSL